MPRQLASNRKYHFKHLNRILRCGFFFVFVWKIGERYLHLCNTSFCTFFFFNCAGVSISGRITRQKFQICRINLPPSLTSTKLTWFGSLWKTPTLNMVTRTAVSISPYLVIHWLVIYPMWAFLSPSPPHLPFNTRLIFFFLVEDLMSMACSSVLRGGGTNQELALHCLHECGGDLLVSIVTQNILKFRLHRQILQN